MVQMGSAVIGGARVVPDATTLRSVFLPVVCPWIPRLSVAETRSLMTASFVSDMANELNQHELTMLAVWFGSLKMGSDAASTLHVPAGTGYTMYLPSH